MSDIDKAAEAICRIDNPHRGGQPADAYEWDIKVLMGGEEGEHYRLMAATALATLKRGYDPARDCLVVEVPES